MLYKLLYSLRDEILGFNVFRYITFRSMLAFVLALGLVLILQPYFIRWVKQRRIGQQVRDDGPQTHLQKQGTPTMGGVVVVFAVCISALSFADISNPYIWVLVLLTVWYALLGFLDDIQKIKGKNTKGVSARGKMIWQIVGACAAVYFLIEFVPAFSTEIALPFFKDIRFDLGWWFIPFAALVIVGSSNAVNLTDGLDGLVTGPLVTVAFAYGVFSYVSGHYGIAEYLQIPFVSGSGELAVFASALIGAGLGFLWFNTFPAQVFMGDVGSLSLGGAIGMLAIITKQELVLPIAGGIFVIEALSVIVQVASFKLRGKRVLLMAPVHHHFELKGIAEPKIIVRCWILSILLALVAISTLKLR